MPVVTVTSPSNTTELPSAESSTRLAAWTAPWKVDPPALAMFTVAVPVMAPVKVTAPEVSMTAVPAPDRPAAVTAPEPPSPRLNVLPASVTVPTVTDPEPAEIVEVAARVTAFRVRAALVVAKVPAKVTLDGAVAVRPPVKVSVSLPSPRTSAPVLLNTVEPAMVALLLKVMPYPALEVTRPTDAVTAPSKVTVPVVSWMVIVVALTEPVMVTPARLLATVRAPAVVPPSAPSVTRPPASRTVRPPLRSAIAVTLAVAPAEEPVSITRPKPWLVTAPTVRSALAPAPVSRVTGPARVTAPRVSAVLVVRTVPASDTVPETPVVFTPPPKVAKSSDPLPRVRLPVFRKVVAPETVTSSRKERS